MKPRIGNRLLQTSNDYQIILLALSAALFAWLMRALLDVYFYAEGTSSATALLGIPARVIYSRVALASCFVLTGTIISHAVRRLKRSHARERRLDQCVRSVRAINQLITRVEDRGTLCRRACEELVSGLGYRRVQAKLDGVEHGLAELPSTAAGSGGSAEREPKVIPISCNGEVFGELIVTPGKGDELHTEEDALLREVSEDIAFSILSMRTAEHLRQQREEVQAILDSVSAYISYKDREGRFIQVNRALASVAGIPQEEWTGKTLAALVPESEASASYSEDEVLSTGRPRHTALEALDLPGGTRWVQSDRVPYRDDSGAIAGVITLSVDVTGRMEAERALACKEEQLRQSQKMEAIGQLAGGVAHDFNNLLTAISGYTELACGQLRPDEPAAEMLDAVLKASGRAAALTNQLLAFSRNQPLWLARRNLNDVVTGMLDMLERLIGEDIELVTELDEDVGSIDADTTQIEQVLMNLAVNARDAMPEGGRLVISTSSAEMPETNGDGVIGDGPRHYAHLCVADNGEGMDAGTLSQIFEPFFTTKRPGVGTGLGLSVVKGIVEQHGGWVQVDSELGRGTTFNICLPKTVQESTEEDLPASTEEPFCTAPSERGERVLLVEDEDGVRAFANRALSEWGYNVVAAPSAEEALVVLDADPEGFDLIFTDIVLPGRSGTQLAEEICSRDPGARILLTSGYLFPDRLGEEGTAGDIGFRLLKKPYSTSALRSAVHDALA